jgi:hypothetical protein
MRRFMVCGQCLKDRYGGSEKCCSPGWDIMTGRPRPGVCSECLQPAEELHCPDGSRREKDVRPA